MYTRSSCVGTSLKVYTYCKRQSAVNLLLIYCFYLHRDIDKCHTGAQMNINAQEYFTYLKQNTMPKHN